MSEQVYLITGTSRGIGASLAKSYLENGIRVVGCSRSELTWEAEDYKEYTHFKLDVCDEKAVKQVFAFIRKEFGRLDVLINNAGRASMNHSLLTPMNTAESLFRTNTLGTFLFCREAAKIMRKGERGRIVNFSTMAVPMKLEGEAVYAASKAAVVSLTQTLAKEYAEFGITVNAVGPVVRTALVKGVPESKLEKLLDRQAIHRFGTFYDVKNVIDFFLKKESDLVTGQVIYLGGS